MLSLLFIQSLLKSVKIKNLLKRIFRIYLLLRRKAVKNYIPIDSSRIHLLPKEGVNVEILVEENKDFTAEPFSLKKKNNSLKPLKAKSEIILIDSTKNNIAFKNNHLITNKQSVIYEANLKLEQLPVYIQKIETPKYYKGTIVYLSNTDISNYYHWMCLTLPLLRFYDSYLGNRNEISYFYLGNGEIKQFHLETLQRAGIDSNKVITEACEGDRIIGIVVNRKEFNGYAPITYESYKFVRNLLLNQFSSDKDEGRKKRIYVKRGNVKRRKVINEEEILEILKSYDFDVLDMDGKTLDEQIYLFSNAECIIAPHGAALTNLLFASEGTKVVEIFPFGYSHNCFYTLANYSGCVYYYLQGENINGLNKEAEYGEGNNLDIYVDIEEFKKICRLLFDNNNKL